VVRSRLRFRVANNPPEHSSPNNGSSLHGRQTRSASSQSSEATQPTTITTYVPSMQRPFWEQEFRQVAEATAAHAINNTQPICHLVGLISRFKVSHKQRSYGKSYKYQNQNLVHTAIYTSSARRTLEQMQTTAARNKTAVSTLDPKKDQFSSATVQSLA